MDGEVEEESEAAKALRVAEADLRKLESMEERAVSLYVSGQIDDRMLTRQRRLYQERLEHYRERVDSLRQQEAAAAAALVLDTVKAWDGRIREGLADMTGEQRRDLLRSVVEGIAVDPMAPHGLTLSLSHRHRDGSGREQDAGDGGLRRRVERASPAAPLPQPLVSVRRACRARREGSSLQR